jgi:hypothetical protein
MFAVCVYHNVPLNLLGVGVDLCVLVCVSLPHLNVPQRNGMYITIKTGRRSETKYRSVATQWGYRYEDVLSLQMQINALYIQRIL